MSLGQTQEFPDHGQSAQKLKNISTKWSPEGAVTAGCLGELPSGPAFWAQLGQKAEHISRATAGCYHQVNLNSFNDRNKSSSTDFKYSFPLLPSPTLYEFSATA